MLANFFGKSKPINFLVLFALFLCYYSVSLIYRDFAITVLLKEFAWSLVIFSVFNFIIAKNTLTYDNSYAFLFLVLLYGFFIETTTINTVFYAHITTLLFLRKVYSLQSNKNVHHKLFDGGLWLGISFIIYPYTVILGFLLYLSTYLHQRINYQTLFIPIIGFFAPVFLYFTYCFWYDDIQPFNELFFWFSNYNFTIYYQPKYWIPIVFIGVCTILSLLLKSSKALAIKNKFRNNWVLLTFHLGISWLIVFFAQTKNLSSLLFLFFPTAVVLTNGLEMLHKKWLKEIVIWLFICGTVLINLL